MRLDEISKSEFRQRLADPRHKLIQDNLIRLEEVFAEWGWNLFWEREEGDFLSYKLIASAGKKPSQRKKLKKFQVTAHKIRIATKNMFWEPGPHEHKNIPDIIVSEFDFTPDRVVMFITHDEDADE